MIFDEEFYFVDARRASVDVRHICPGLHLAQRLGLDRPHVTCQ